MASALKRFLVLGLFTLVLVGCGQSEPIRYAHEERLYGEEFAEKPRVRDLVTETVDEMFGDSPLAIRVPEGAGLPEGGRYLAPFVREFEEDGQPGAPRPVAYRPGGSDRLVPIEGGQAIYHRHCLHCHGVSGDGEGPTAKFLYPRPRDYRRGLFKFTSTQYGRKPTRDDLRRTIRHGIHGTSMPAFEAQLSPQQIEQVLDYVIFLSMRGEVERALVEEASYLTDEDVDEPEEIEEFQAIASDISQGTVFAMWANADSAIVRPETPRVPSTPESIARGRELFLGISRDVKLECVGCHGPRAIGNGPSWIDPETFDKYVFDFTPEASDISRLAAIADKAQKRWGDDWGDPLRPANLNEGVYKGGRRPIDIYWRIATGITGTPMPAHAQTLKDPDDLWHLVNFVLALPYDSELLRPDRLRQLGVATRPDQVSTTASR